MAKKTAFGQSLLLALVVSASILHCSAQEWRPLTPEDVFRLNEITQLALSPDGEEILFTVRRADLPADTYRETLWRVRTDRLGAPTRLTDDNHVYEPQWSPDGSKIAFLSSRDGAPQVWAVDREGGRATKLTSNETGVISFRWSPDGGSIAFTAPSAGKSALETSSEELSHAFVVDKMNVNLYQFLGNQLFLDLTKPTRLWLIDLASGKTEELIHDSSVADFAFSPDGRTLAVAEQARPDAVSPTNIALYSLATGARKVILSGTTADGWYVTREYSRPFWSPDGTRLAVLYQDNRNHDIAQLGIYILESGRFTLLTSPGSLELDQPRFSWCESNTIYLENTHRAGRHLYALSVNDGSTRPITGGDFEGSEFTFDSSRDLLVFVRQSLQSPPEIFSSRRPFQTATKITAVNAEYASFQLPETERVHWGAPDGTQVEGWLFKPFGFREGTRYPTLVFVHGGPIFAVANQFEPYWFAWPYSFRLLAERGYLVFLPNYRGTGSYGESFRGTTDSEILRDGSADIIAGIESLEKRGIVDPGRLGIFGQSYGAWLGPLIMGQHRIFKAASFAEGPGDMLSAYSYVPGWHNLASHEAGPGVSPYEDPVPYLKISPVFYFKDVRTATLLEYGEQSLAISGLEMLSALWREGVPHEMVVYPNTGHNISSPKLQMDSIKRNLAWFEFWIPPGADRGKDITPEQLVRWKRMEDSMRRLRLRNGQQR